MSWWKRQPEEAEEDVRETETEIEATKKGHRLFEEPEEDDGDSE